MSAASDQAEQLAFAQALRDSAAAAPAWIAARPLQIYRELAFNNLQRALARSFAVSHSLLSEARWNALVGAFFKTLRTREPQLRRLPAESLLRTKGLLAIEGELRPYVIQGVQHSFSSPLRLPTWPTDDRRGYLVLIASDLDPALLDQALAPLLHPAEIG